MYETSTLIYLAAVLAIKISILLLYSRVFAVGRKMRNTIRVLIFILVVSSIVTFFIYLIVGRQSKCRAFLGLWKDRTFSYQCFSGYVALLTLMTHAAMNLLTDLFTLIIPFPMVWRLQLSRKKKICVTAVFVMGSRYGRCFSKDDGSALF